MESMEEKLGAVLNNPQIMQQIMSMAQSLGASSTQSAVEEPQQSISMPDLNPAMLQQVMSLASQTGLDRNQKALLSALTPYLTQPRLQKLEKAMRAAKLANLATTAINSGALSFLAGR